MRNGPTMSCDSTAVLCGNSALLGWRCLWTRANWPWRAKLRISQPRESLPNAATAFTCEAMLALPHAVEAWPRHAESCDAAVAGCGHSEIPYQVCCTPNTVFGAGFTTLNKRTLQVRTPFSSFHSINSMLSSDRRSSISCTTSFAANTAAWTVDDSFVPRTDWHAWQKPRPSRKLSSALRTPKAL